MTTNSTARSLAAALNPNLLPLNAKVAPLLLNQKQAYEALGMSRTTFYNYVAQGLIAPVILPRGGRRYDYDDLKRFVMELKAKQRKTKRVTG